MGERKPPTRDDRGIIELAGLFPSFFDAAPDAILVVTDAGLIVVANRQAEVMFGYPRGELVGRPVEDLVPDRYEAVHIQHRARYMNDPTVRPMGAQLDLRGKRVDGSEFPVEISLSPIETAAGTLVMAAVRDITDRVQAERKFEDLVEAAPDAIVLVDRSGHITLVNRQAEILFGHERQDLLGEFIEVLVPPRYREAHVAHRDGYMANPEVRPMGVGLELSGVRSDGTEFPVEISLSPLESEDGSVAMAVVRDMSEHEVFKRELRRYADRLERSNEEWERFAHVVSHDLREPLRMVTSYVQLVAREIGEDASPTARESMEFAVEGAQRMHELLGGLLEYARVDTRGRPPQMVPAGGVVDEVLADLQVAIEEARATVTRDELPTVMADRTQLRQLFQNLVANAIKFHDEGHEPNVAIRASETEDGWHFEVEDDGIGVEPGQEDRVFGLFQRLHGRDVYDGQGIGLTVCRRIVERHGGRIWYESEPGKGTTFHFTLPRTPPPEAV